MYIEYVYLHTYKDSKDKNTHDPKYTHEKHFRWVVSAWFGIFSNTDSRFKSNIKTSSIRTAYSIKNKICWSDSLEFEKYFIGHHLSGRYVKTLNCLVMSNPLDSRKTKLLKTKTVDFPINNKQFSIKLFQKNHQNNHIIFIENSKK